MEVTKEINGITVTHKNFSPTLKEKFGNGQYSPTTKIAMHCVPHIGFSVDKTRKIASIKMDWGIKATGAFEFFMDDQYYIYYEDYNDEKLVIDELVKASKLEFSKKFNKESGVKMSIDFNDFYGEVKEISLRDQILSIIHSRD
jgi:hypothetical protein